MYTKDAIRYSLNMAEHATMRALATIDDAPLTFPTEKGGCHPLWVMGHLAFVEGFTHEMLGGGANPVAHWAAIFGQDTVPTGPGVNLFEVGTLAYVESPSSDGYVLVPCTVVKVTEDDVQVKINTARCGYARGTLVNTGHRDVIPRTRVEKPKSRDYVINPGWIWAQS